MERPNMYIHHDGERFGLEMSRNGTTIIEYIDTCEDVSRIRTTCRKLFNITVSEAAQKKLAE